MNIATFDVYGNDNTDNHGINLYHQIFFNGKKIRYEKKESKYVNIRTLTKILNNLDMRASHNFSLYDGGKLPGLKNHSDGNIDTLLIDSLLCFDRPHHHLEKSVNNNPIEDAHLTFLVLEKNIVFFHHLNKNIKEILYSLLIANDIYKDFFLFYNSLTGNSLRILSEKEILKRINAIVSHKGVTQGCFDYASFFKNNETKLALCYILLFLEKQKVVLPDFISINNSTVKSILRDTLHVLYNDFMSYLRHHITFFLKEYYNFDSFRGEIQEDGVLSSLNLIFPVPIGRGVTVVTKGNVNFK